MSNDIEWKMVKLGDVAKFLPTNTLSRDELNYSEGEYLNIHYGDVLIKFDSVTDVLNSEIPFVSLNKKFSDKSLLKNGDIVMADTAEDESVGKVTEIQNVGNNKVVSGLHTLCMRFQENLFAPKFAGYYLNSRAFHNLLLPYMHGTKVTSISKGDVKKIIFPIPYKNGEADLETQELIAQKLGDMDSLIAAKEKLLAKKRDLKIGAMQKLIKDEESENWKKVKLGEVIQHLRTGLNPRSNFELNPADANGYYITVRELKGFDIITDEKTDRINANAVAKINERSKLKINDILFSGTGTIGETALVKENPDNWGIKEGIYAITPNTKKINSRFLLYYFQTTNAILLFEEMSTGSTIKSVPMLKLKTLPIPIPYKNGTPDLAEQKRIASILSDMDSEISSIENEIIKLQNLKTGMMQSYFSFNEVEE